tara:strand:- start:26 stop:175 length:150 start_codon:yes stop_codon:yes gene_type:complete
MIDSESRWKVNPLSPELGAEVIGSFSYILKTSNHRVKKEVASTHNFFLD